MKFKIWNKIIYQGKREHTSLNQEQNYFGQNFPNTEHKILK